MSASRSVVSSAKLIALCTLLSRVTGMLRDMLLAQAFGLGWVQDAFNYAFQFPNLFRRLFGEGALSAAFVPAFTRVMESEGRPSAWALFLRTFTLLTIVLVAIVLLVELLIGGIWALLRAQGTAEALAWGLPLALTAIVMPFMIFICLLALFSSLLNCLGSFVPAALASVVLNIVIIAGVVWLGPLVGGDDPARQVFGVAISVVLAGAAQLAFIYPAMRQHGVPLGWSVAPRDPHVRRLLTTMAPALLGQGVLLVSVFLDTQACALLTRKPGAPETTSMFGLTFAYPLQEGALSAVAYAQRLYQFPLGVLVISIATAALPAFSRLAARRDWPAWGAEVRGLLRLAAFEGLLAGCLMVPLAAPIVRLLFEYRAFDADDTRRAAAVLAWYGAGLWAYCAHHIVLRGFYSLGDVRTPLVISLLVLPLNLALALALVWVESIREAGFAIATCVTSTLAVAAGAVLLARRGRARILDLELGGALARMLVAALLTGAIVAVARPAALPLLSGLERWPIALRACDALGWLAAGSAAFLLISALLGLREPGVLLGRRRTDRG